MHSTRRFAKLFIPPVVLKLSSALKKQQWEYVGEHWPEHDSRSAGWDSEAVARIMKQKWGAYKQATDGTSPLGFMPWATEAPSLYAHNHIMTYAVVLARAARGAERLSVLDWGGAMGHYVATSKALLPDNEFDFTVKERPAICEGGREIFPDVKFSSSESVLDQQYDLVVAAGSLQYEKDWRHTVSRFANAARNWLFLTTAPVVRSGGGFVVVQRPHSTGLKTEYISWVFGYDALIETLAQTGFKLERTFLCSTDPQRYRGTKATSELMGFLLRRSF